MNRTRRHQLGDRVRLIAGSRRFGIHDTLCRQSVVRLALICTCMVGTSACRRSNDQPPGHIEEAIRAGDTAQLTKWLAANPNLAEKPLESGLRLMHVAAMADQVKCAELLLAHGASPDTIDHRSRTPLFHAAAWGHAESVAWFLRHGAAVDHRDQDAHQAIHLAVQNGHEVALSMLIARGADVNARLTEGTTPLHSAVSLDYVNITKILVEAGADPNATKNDGITPLRIAKAKANTQIVKLLEGHAGP